MQWLLKSQTPTSLIYARKRLQNFMFQTRQRQKTMTRMLSWSAFYSLKSASRAVRELHADCMFSLGYKSCFADPDLLQSMYQERRWWRHWVKLLLHACLYWQNLDSVFKVLKSTSHWKLIQSKCPASPRSKTQTHAA